jgi:predicted TIM-barrel fold metal-dependent hydrolase
MTKRIFDRIRAIDTDTHITEPPDVWTARVSTKKWGDVGSRTCAGTRAATSGSSATSRGAPGFVTMAGFDGSLPEGPRGYDDIPKSSFDAKARLAHMDAEGIYAQVLYPNVGGFGSGGFLKLKEPELMLECVRAYNDFLVDWCSADANRLIPVAAMPFWDVGECVKEVERAVAKGHRAVLAASQPDAWGEPSLASSHWDPFWAAVQETGVPISFHIGGGDLSDCSSTSSGSACARTSRASSSMIFMQNVHCIADLIFGGVCHRFPSSARVGGERRRLDPVVPRGGRLAVREQPDAQGAPRVRPAAERVLQAPDLRLLLVRVRGREGRARRVPRQHALGDRLSPPDLSASGPHGRSSPSTRPTTPSARSRASRVTIEKVLHSTAASLYGIQ